MFEFIYANKFLFKHIANINLFYFKSEKKDCFGLYKKKLYFKLT